MYGGENVLGPSGECMHYVMGLEKGGREGVAFWTVSNVDRVK